MAFHSHSQTVAQDGDGNFEPLGGNPCGVGRISPHPFLRGEAIILPRPLWVFDFHGVVNRSGDGAPDSIRKGSCDPVYAK